MATNDSKTCRVCKSVLTRNDFYGSLSECKRCTCKRVKANRDRNLEAVRAYDRYRYHHDEARRAAHKLACPAHRAKYPEKYKARTALNNALRDGRIVKLPCKCGSLKSEAHHTDYSRPLDVEWVCKPCHEANHHRTETIDAK